LVAITPSSPGESLRTTGAISLPKLIVPHGFGVNIHFRGEPKDLDLISEAGFKFIRMDLTWEGVERKKGSPRDATPRRYEFEKSGYDALTKGCSKRGIRILYILDYSNRLYESDRSVRTEKGRKAFAAFARAAAGRYKGRGILWEIWNEPNIKQFWRPQPSAEDYCKLVKVTAPLIKKADPSGLIVAPATSGIPFKWLEDCFRKGLLNWIDVLSVHPYRPHPPETVIKDYARLRELIKRYAPKGRKIPIISGEWGYSNINWDKARLSDDRQAQYLVREFLVNLHQGIPVSIWYDWKNDGTNPDEREHHFGTVMHDLKPKAAYLAAKTLSFTLRGYSIDQRINFAGENDFALKLTKDGNQAVAFWTTDREHEAKLPPFLLSQESRGGEGTLVSLFGEKTELSWRNDALKVRLTQSPRYLLPAPVVAQAQVIKR
jgi:hypothetical protein